MQLSADGLARNQRTETPQLAHSRSRELAAALGELLCPGPGKARRRGDLRVGEPTLVHAADNGRAGVSQTVSDGLLQDLLGGQG